MWGFQILFNNYLIKNNKNILINNLEDLLIIILPKNSLEINLYYFSRSLKYNQFCVKRFTTYICDFTF